jgi:hypothetical protein
MSSIAGLVGVAIVEVGWRGGDKRRECALCGGECDGESGDLRDGEGGNNTASRV